MLGAEQAECQDAGIDRDSEADGQVQGRGDQHHRHRPQPGRHTGHPPRRRHRRQLLQHVQPQPVRPDRRPGHRRGVRKPAHGRPQLPRRLPPAPGPPDAPRPQPAGPHPTLPSGGLRRRRRVLIDTRLSPFLRRHGSESQSHDLECHLHGIAGWQGDDRGFELVVDRDVALVNKFDDCLADEYPVPVRWKVHHNKSMVKGPDGRWVLQDHEPDDDDDDDD